LELKNNINEKLNYKENNFLKLLPCGLDKKYDNFQEIQIDYLFKFFLPL